MAHRKTQLERITLFHAISAKQIRVKKPNKIQINAKSKKHMKPILTKIQYSNKKSPSQWHIIRSKNTSRRTCHASQKTAQKCP